MNIQRFEVPGLAQYSYMVSDGGDAIVIDPIRDVERYVEYAAAMELKITHIVETHIHADFAAGSTALAAATGAELAFSAYDRDERFTYAMPHRELGDGESIMVGNLRLQALHTPGHTPEHLSFLLFDLTQSANEAVCIFSGDFLFVGSLGRPDLLGEEAKVGLAHALYHSVQHKIVNLSDGLMIYPGHGAGSLCGAGLSERAESTLGYERRTNPFFQYGEEEFVEKILASVPPMPDYYPRMKALNAQGASLLQPQHGTAVLSPEHVARLQAEGTATLLDLRRPEAFGGAHLESAINIGAGQNLSLWAGWLLSPDRPIVLITEDGDDAEARRALARVGLDNVAGHLSGGMSGWIATGRDFVRTMQQTVSEVEQEKDALILDVRSPQERTTGSIADSQHLPLGKLPQSLNLLSKARRIITVCGSGYRSSIAASILAAAGFKASSMNGGMGAWRQRGLALTT